MTTPIKNMLVGVFILSSIAILVSVILFLKPSVGDGKQTLNVRFSDIGSLNVGTRVLFAGKPVGEVVSMEEIKDARDQPTDELGRVYFYQLTLHIDSKMRVYNTDEISIQRSGLLGEKSIAITPKAPPKGVTPTLLTSQPIYADSVDSLQSALIDFTDLSATMEETFRTMGDWMKKYGEEVGGAVAAATGAMGEIGQAIASCNEIDMFNQLGGMVHDLHTVSKEMADGKGTIGKLVVGDDLYLEMNSLMTKANNLMNDVNHYGILFHLNKQWQRTRLQKINELNALNSPQQFQLYFQTEVDDINASMARISILIEKAENNPERQRILNSEPFKRDFAELLRKADELSSNLKLYNQQLNQATGSD